MGGEGERGGEKTEERVGEREREGKKLVTGVEKGI